MGIRFDLQSANWLAHVIDPNKAPPRLDSLSSELETLRAFLTSLNERFYSSPSSEHILREMVHRALVQLEQSDFPHAALPASLLGELRSRFAQRPWTALLTPSGDDSEPNRTLCSASFLQSLVQVSPDNPGLILQLKEISSDQFTLTDVFPAFRTALARSTEWPGVLVWTMRGDSTFLPLPSLSVRQLTEAAHRIFSILSTSIGVDLEVLSSAYHKEFPSSRRAFGDKLHFVQVSDVHIGCAEANKRLPRVQQLIRNIFDELGEEARIIPVVSGDLMDTPGVHIEGVRAFLDVLAGLGDVEPIVVLGNHDVRTSGYLKSRLREALRLPTSNGRVEWFDPEGVALLCFNSVVRGHLARGFIGEQQLLDVGSQLDRHADWRDYCLIGLLHHHPIAVTRPEWYAAPFYERVFGRMFEFTEVLEDADEFLAFAANRNLAAILHGHKHIPRVATTLAGEIPVFGCGSTVGKIATTDGRPYMSINVITVDSRNRRITGRLLAERIPGGGLLEERRHEVVARSSLKRTSAQ